MTQDDYIASSICRCERPPNVHGDTVDFLWLLKGFCRFCLQSNMNHVLKPQSNHLDGNKYFLWCIARRQKHWKWTRFVPALCLQATHNHNLILVTVPICCKYHYLLWSIRLGVFLLGVIYIDHHLYCIGFQTMGFQSWTGNIWDNHGKLQNLQRLM